MKPKLVAVVGPTGVGKSALAVEIALEFGGEVVNADSRLFYCGLDIGTAKPTLTERRGVPHHLIDMLGPDESFSLASFLDAARAVIEDITARRKLPVFAGGTGQYVWGLIEGWDVPRVPPEPALRQSLEAQAREHGVEVLHARLAALDPEAAAVVDQLNPRRVLRALERALVGDGAGRPRKAIEPPYDALVIGITMPRKDLYARVDRRIEAMAAAGWVDEVRRLLKSGLKPGAPAMTGIGYREMAAYIRGEMSLEDALAAAKRSTRRLIRHQYNWFKPDDGRIRWLDASQSAASQAAVLVREWMTRQA